MADIAFLLIIYFIVTTVFSATKGLDMPLPDEDPPEAPATVESIYVEVLPDGSLKVDGQAMALGDLLAYVAPNLRINQSKPVILHPDPAAPYQSMIAVYDELTASAQKTGVPVRNLVVPTQREIQEYIALLGTNPFANPGR
jgi:biopolymer transport protein ExbD